MPSLKFTPHCPLHPETEHMFDDKLIGKMNVARISSIRGVARSVTVTRLCGRLRAGSSPGTPAMCGSRSRHRRIVLRVACP